MRMDETKYFETDQNGQEQTSSPTITAGNKKEYDLSKRETYSLDTVFGNSDKNYQKLPELIGRLTKIKKIDEIERNRKFQMGLLGIKEKTIKVVDIDIRNYAKYILRDGTMTEKRELLSCLRSKITMAEKHISIVSV